MTRTFAVLATLCVTGCASSITLRASTNDFLKPAATEVTVSPPPQQVIPMVERLFLERGFTSAGPALQGENNTAVYLFKGLRAPSAGTVGMDLGSWFAVRITGQGSGTLVSVLGKPMVSGLEVCSDADELLRDVKYTCVDTRVPDGWSGRGLVSGRDETEVVSWVLTALYERLR